jgi:indolepyruvate ferredoxin oxidoreductase beta subunit
MAKRRRRKGFDLVLAGVGGQGILMAGRILCQAAMEHGHKVNAFEMHGMAQRGGAVVSHIRWGRQEDVYAALMLEGEADMLVALEPVEGLRHLSLFGERTVAVLNTKAIPPITVSAVPGAKYPSIGSVVRSLKPHVGKVITLNGTSIAEELGLPAITSTVLIGAALGTRRLPLRKDKVLKAVQDLVPERFVDENIKALDLGMRAARKK